MLYLFAMNPATSPPALLQQIARIPQMERGTLSIIRTTPDGPFYNHQAWENGKNVSRYVPRDQMADLREAIEGYRQFKQLTQAYAEQIIQQTRAERAVRVKKNPLQKSSSPKRKKFSS